jgi:hypothetical protein
VNFAQRKNPQINAKEIKLTSERHWEIVKEKFICKEYSIVEVVSAMNWINSLEITNYKNDLANYLQSRKNKLIDSEKSSDCEEINLQHEKLRCQYQDIFGKDIKYN